MQQMAEKGLNCQEYVQLVRFIRSGMDVKDTPPDHPARAHASILAVMGMEETPRGPILLVEGSRIVVPTTERRRLVELLHSTHLSDRSMIKTARRLWWWTSMNNQIDILQEL